MSDVGTLETRLEIAEGTLEGIGRLLTAAGVPEATREGMPLHISYRVRIALGMEAAPDSQETENEG